ncbi:MAG: DUF262 domain-containing protein [Rhodothermaceae bacterium]|nr:DUF262 domain-containing protein [Gammaproteobacteria bacterium]MXW15587.1 DUF262 domain-containing protein [Rhodothermaceae bacterium]MYC05467.1 DUF262 domain-containing protein [Rhodothermaceae bacterium]MYI17284.1 DUF262 domain-containing protein [Rhodothermaceae bacterium]
MSNPKPLIKARPYLFSKLLQRGLFEVPWHQRYYDWELREVKELLGDIEEAITEERHSYFLGTVILVKKKPTRWEINDGQQRLITFSLICAVLCRKFADNGSVSDNEARALRIMFNLDDIERCSLDDAQHYSPRITPQHNDKVSYSNMIRGNSIGANGVITTAWKEIEKFVFSQTLQESEDYFEFLVQKLEVACLEVPPKIDPNAVFEAINCRGKRLDDLDLIRNYLYSHFNAEKHLEKRKSVHENLERIRTRSRTKGRASEFMRCCLQCEFGFLQKDRFYRDVRTEIKKQANSISNKALPDYVFGLTEKLADPKSLGLFLEVIISPNPDPETIKAFNRDSGKTNAHRNLPVFLWELRGYTVTQPLVFGLLMTYLRETDGRRKKRIARIVHNKLSNLATFVLRTAFVAPKFEPSNFEKKFSEFAKKIAQDGEISDGEFADFLLDCDRDNFGVLDDSRFKERLYEAQMKGAAKIKRFLFGVNRNPPRSSQIFKDSEFTVEHILPQSNQHWGNWTALEGQDLGEWVNRIGNLTLLTKTDNRPTRNFNRSFERKKEIYADSSLSITSRLVQEYDDWTPETIERRQRHMVKRAVEVWRFHR